jgi:hypothetical protein
MKRITTAVFAILLLASIANAQHGGGGMGMGPGGPGEGFGGGQVIVGSDGTVYLTRTTIDTGTRTSTTQLIAVRSNGTTAWTVTLSNAGRLLLAGSNLISVNEARNSDGTFGSTVTALASATGATAWTQTVSGRITELEAFSGGIYAVVITPATTTGGTAMRSLVAISNSGAVLWTVNV